MCLFLNTSGLRYPQVCCSSFSLFVDICQYPKICYPLLFSQLFADLGLNCHKITENVYTVLPCYSRFRYLRDPVEDYSDCCIGFFNYNFSFSNQFLNATINIKIVIYHLLNNEKVNHNQNKLKLFSHFSLYHYVTIPICSQIRIAI